MTTLGVLRAEAMDDALADAPQERLVLDNENLECFPGCRAVEVCHAMLHAPLTMVPREEPAHLASERNVKEGNPFGLPSFTGEKGG